jgi:hypothetical protein
MSFANFGIGVGAFSRGLVDGMQLGKQIKEVRNENELSRIRKDGMAGAQEARSRDVDALIRPLEVALPEDQEGPVMSGYNVGETNFGSREEASKYAESKVGSIQDYFFKDTAPKLMNTLIEQGRMEDAEKMEGLLQSRRFRRGTEQWARGFSALNMGDMDAAADSLVKAYNTSGYFDDGVTAKGYEKIKDSNGNVTGMRLNFERDGKSFSQEVDASNMYQTLMQGFLMISPEKGLNMMMQGEMEAGKARAAAAKDDRKFMQNVAIEGVRQEGRQSIEDSRQNNRIELEGIRSQRTAANAANNVQAQYNQKAAILRAAGRSQEEIDANVEALLGLDRKGISEADMRFQVMRQLMNDQMAEVPFNELPREEQERLIDSYIDLVRMRKDSEETSRSSGSPVNSSLGLPRLSDDNSSIIR